MPKLIKDNGLTIVLTLLFLSSLIGQWLTGAALENEALMRHGQQPMDAVDFLSDPGFLSTVFENWESEFLQMASYVILTAVLFQQGSAESRKPDAGPRDPALQPKSGSPSAPHALRRGPLARWLYAHSLGLVLLIMFFVSFALHWRFSAQAAAQEAALHGDASKPLWRYVLSSQLWFESFQNWQSEFLSAALLVVLSIWLRQANSPESKSVAAAHSETGA